VPQTRVREPLEARVERLMVVEGAEGLMEAEEERHSKGVVVEVAKCLLHRFYVRS
jgi:hypothetical protein